MPSRLANAIPLHPSLSGPQLAGWTPGPPVQTGLGCRLLPDQPVPMTDGVTLAADVYLPKEPGRHAAVLSFSAYSKELAPAGVPMGNNEIGSPPVFTDRGYARVVATRRGMGGSTGERDVFFGDQDVQDLEQLVAWTAAQPWCTGDVVMFGTSYFGVVQPQVAVRRPPALKAIFTNEMCTDYFRHIVNFGGVPGLDFASLWTGANFTERMVNLHVPPAARAAASQVLNSPVKPVWERAVHHNMARIMGTFHEHQPVPDVLEQYANWMFDGKTRATNAIPAGPSGRLGEIDIPFVVVQNLGYFNLHQFGCYDLFENASTPAGRKWLILAKAEYELPVYSWQLEALAFFDHVLHGADNGYASQPPVRYWVDGADAFHTASAFPEPGWTPLRLHPASAGEDRATHTLRAGEPPAEGTNRWAAVPIGLQTVAGLDTVANQTLTFDYPVADELELAGAITVSLRFSSNEIDSHVVARLGRVDRDGTFHHLSLGTIRPARRTVDAVRSTSCEIAIDADVPQPLVPGEPVTLRFSLTPQPVLLRAGETLRLDLASRTDLLRSDVSHGYVHFDLPVPPYLSRNTIHYGPETYLELNQRV